jgi:hypothetical protein
LPVREVEGVDQLAVGEEAGDIAGFEDRQAPQRS